MYIIRLSLFCVSAFLVGGVYANDFSDSADAVAKTAEFSFSNSPMWESRADLQPNVGTIGDDAQWLRISDEGGADGANRESRPANSTPRWVF
jgi:hypothetical protein